MGETANAGTVYVAAAAARLLGLAVIVAAVGLCAAEARAEQVKLIATRDVWVSSVAEEADDSMGKTPQLKLKVNDEVALLDFDVSALRGRRIEAAELWMHNVAESVAEEKKRLGVPEERPDCLRKIGVSTVSSPWEEGEQAATYRPDPAGHGATYDQASYGERNWAYPGSKLWAVIMGNGNSVHCHGEREYRGDGWWRVAVEPRLISALVAGLSYGLVVEEESSTAGWVAANNYVHSRESGEYAPYLVVTSEASEEKAPQPPASLTVEPAPDFATLGRGAARIGMFVPNKASGFLVTMSGEEVARWRVPLAEGDGRWQSFVLDDLSADQELKLEVRAVSEAGLISEAAVATGRSSPPQASPPALPASPFRPSAGGTAPAKDMRAWAYPEVTKVDPVTGEAMFEPVRELRGANAVWDGARSLVRLAAARGEIAAFQLAVQTTGEPLSGVSVEVGDLRGASGVIGKEQFRLFRVWYVEAGGQWQEEYASPLTGQFAVPSPDNAVPGQRVQAVYIDIIVPGTAAADTYRGSIRVSAEGGLKAELAVELVVYPVTIPNEIAFSPELNCYEPPGGKAGTPYFYEAHRLAHYHRCTINSVHYSHSGRIIPEYVPKLGGDGAAVHVSDWSEYDGIFGPLFDGSAFEGNPRGRVPVRAFYLPLHENWPLPLLQYYAFREPPRNEQVIVRHQLQAPPIAQALPEAYQAGFRNVARDFVSHFEEKGWTSTDFQMYLNNKYSYWGATYWTLDEPTCRDDWQAMRFFAQLFKSVMPPGGRVRFVFRGDVSRPWWQYDQLDGLMDTIYYGGDIFEAPGFAREFNRRIPDPHVYGACNQVAESDHQSAAWCLKAYVVGLDGVLPWNSLGEAESLRQASQTALIVPGELAGFPGPVASLRVFALRQGAQLVELLRMLAQEKGYSREQIGALVAQRVPLGGEFKQTFADEAAALRFGVLSAQGFSELKEGVLLLLSQ
jgi:hypothetical protein